MDKAEGFSCFTKLHSEYQELRSNQSLHLPLPLSFIVPFIVYKNHSIILISTYYIPDTLLGSKD